jgi:hypothetical protein
VDATANVAGHFLPKTNNAYMLVYDRVEVNVKAQSAAQVSLFLLFSGRLFIFSDLCFF